MNNRKDPRDPPALFFSTLNKGRNLACDSVGSMRMRKAGYFITGTVITTGKRDSTYRQIL